MMKKLNSLKEEIVALYKDYNAYPELYGVILGALIYQLIAHVLLSYVPYPAIRIFTWMFFMMLF